jgi:hypothetical protein
VDDYGGWPHCSLETVADVGRDKVGTPLILSLRSTEMVKKGGGSIFIGAWTVLLVGVWSISRWIVQSETWIIYSSCRFTLSFVQFILSRCIYFRDLFTTSSHILYSSNRLIQSTAMTVEEPSTNGINGTANSTESVAAEGSLPITTKLYQGPKDEDKNFSWLDHEPDDVAEAAENAQTAQHALITRLQKAEDSRKKYEMHSLIVQSPWLKSILHYEILDGYPGVSCGLKRLEFEAPFQPFVHRWGKLLAVREKKDLDETTKEHLDLLYGVLSEELKDVIKTLEDYVQNGIVKHEHIWTIFQPGDIIYSQSFQGAPTALMFQSGNYVRKNCGMVYQLSAEVIDWNGNYFGRSTAAINLVEFRGTRRILGLRAFPLSFHPHKAKVEEVLIRRGKKFEELAGCHYKEYNGFAVTWDKEDEEVPTSCSGRIIIDSDSFRRFSPQCIDYIEHLEVKEGISEPESAPEIIDVGSQIEDTYVFGKEAEAKRMRLTEQLQLICLPRVRGYSLKKKQWFLFYVDLVKDIKFDEKAFQSLVLPEDQKELILSFAESQAMNQNIFDDVISGKGRGHITLLSGPPGVGKTLTAESVAENMKAPLYMMSAGDLGIDADTVERRLTDILEMIAKWKAVLLIDECDVFLEARSTHDLERNKLVSIFLRVLEYYEGILFLTTNRLEDIDPAFQSRIHVSMAYPDLTSESRRHIWANFLEGLEVPQDWSERDLDELATVELNGRQIKNVLKSATLLSARKKQPLGRKFVDTVLAIEKRRPGVAESS